MEDKYIDKYINKYIKYKNKYIELIKKQNKKRDHEETLSFQSGGGLIEDFMKDPMITIGEGFRVKVYTNSKYPEYIVKVYSDKILKRLADNEVDVHKIIMTKMKDKMNLEYVSIPSLIESKTIEDPYSIINMYNRVYNYNDMDVHYPSYMTHVYITTKTLGESESFIAGRGNVVNLKFIEGIVGKSILIKMIEELGCMLAYLNYTSNILLDDIEFVFGKDKIDTTSSSPNYKFFILDFDRASIYKKEDMDKYTEFFISTMLGRKDYLNFEKINDSYMNAFNKGYLDVAKKTDNKEIAIKVLEKIKGNYVDDSMK